MPLIRYTHPLLLTEACRTTHNLLPSAESHLQLKLGTAPHKVKTGSSIHRLCAAWVHMGTHGYRYASLSSTRLCAAWVCMGMGMPLSPIHMSVCSMGIHGYRCIGMPLSLILPPACSMGIQRYNTWVWVCPSLLRKR